MMPLWAVELADEFWRLAGAAPPFPRDLRDALDDCDLDATIAELSSLSIRKVENYLAHQYVHRSTNEPDRPLRACVAALGEVAWIFLDKDDPDDEKAGSTAHEVAHFLRHSRQPRRLAIAALGPSITDVLDGKRRPTPVEAISAALRDVKLGVHVHYLRRDGGIPSAARLAEYEADLLAWQLVAPCDEVRRLAADYDAARTLLRETFGLPATMADEYADWLYPEERTSPVVEKLISFCRTRGEARE